MRHDDRTKSRKIGKLKTDLKFFDQNNKKRTKRKPTNRLYFEIELFPGNRNKRKGNGAGQAGESQSLVLHTHTLLVQTHNMTTVKEIA